MCQYYKGYDINDIYKNVVYDLLHKSEKVSNTSELRNVTIELDNIDNAIVGVRDISPSYLFGELLWYFTGNQSVNFISKFSSMWSRLSDDGRTSNSAYGHIMKYRHGFNQIEKVIELLMVDPNSRRAVINLNVPNSQVIETKDEPCTIALQFVIRDERLHCTTVMRSNDIWFGLPYDIAFFTELQRYIAERLNVATGSYVHFVTSLHMYDRDEEKLKKVLKGEYGTQHITFNKEKFHAKKYVIADLIILLMEEDDPKKLVLNLMKEFCDYEYTVSM